MSFWQTILDNSGDYDRGARRQLQDLQLNVANAADSQTVAMLAQRLSQAERQIDQLLLGCAALGRLLEMKGVVPEEALVTMMQQLDLLDGKEDGSMGSRISEDAPRCQGCNHFVNPARSACVYCNRSLTANPNGGLYRGAQPSAPPVSQVSCSSCKRETAQTETVFNAHGELVCMSCA